MNSPTASILRPTQRGAQPISSFRLLIAGDLQLDRQTRQASLRGTVLALTLVQKIIALHDGTIDVRSREGHGTVIRIRLPLAPPA